MKGDLHILKAYCVFCKTGSENAIAQRVNAMSSGIKAIVPVRVLQEKYKKKWIERERLLIPGYVFVYAKREISFRKLIKMTGAYKVLEYQSGKRELIGSDYEYALWVYTHNGRIGTSKVLVEGDTVKVIDGPLKDGIGEILKLDRHKKRAWVEFNFYGNTQKVSLSVVDITPMNFEQQFKQDEPRSNIVHS